MIASWLRARLRSTASIVDDRPPELLSNPAAHRLSDGGVDEVHHRRGGRNRRESPPEPVIGNNSFQKRNPPVALEPTRRGTMAPEKT